MRKFIAIMLITNIFICGSNASWKIDFVDRNEDLSSIRKVFFHSFMSEFKNLTAEEMKLRWSPKEVWADNLFKIETDLWRMMPGKRWLLKATDKNNHEILSACLLSQDEEDEKAIFGIILCVNPDFQRLGIGKSFGLFIADNFPNHDTLKAITGKFNQKALNFYKKNGFKKSNMKHPSLETGAYVALERPLKAKL